MAEMFERLFGNTMIPVLSQVAAFTQARHRAILSNIANADTPGYRARDVAELEFHRQLRQAAATRRRRPAGGFGLRSSTHNRVTRDGRILFEPVPSPDAGPPGPNGNNVNLERQIVALTKNTVRHNAALALMRRQFALIEAVIRERI